MKFSDYFGVSAPDLNSWFDPVLSVDTKLFIDPFLIYDHGGEAFGSAHDEIVAFFNSVLSIMAKSAGDKSSTYYKRALRRLVFPEVEEICLGFSSNSTKGIGSGKDIARFMGAAMWEAISRGLICIEHFEEVTLLETGIGADRISDMTANILRGRFADYTQNICVGLNIPTSLVRIRHHYDVNCERWISGSVQLPINPYNNKPIILVPSLFLRELPTMNANDFWDFCWVNYNEVLRQEFGDDIKRNVNKDIIVGFARNKASIRKEYEYAKENEGSVPYDIYNDPKGYVRWYDATKAYCEPLLRRAEASITSVHDLISFSFSVFKDFIEDEENECLLWGEGKPLNKTGVQRLLLGIVKHVCFHMGASISDEYNIGSGISTIQFNDCSIGFVSMVRYVKNLSFWRSIEARFASFSHDGINTIYLFAIHSDESDYHKMAVVRDSVDRINKRFKTPVCLSILDGSKSDESAQLEIGFPSGKARNSLYEFLLRSYNNDEFNLLLQYLGGAWGNACYDIPSTLSPASFYMDKAISVLCRRALIDERFFSALISSRSVEGEIIKTIACKWGVYI